MMTTTKCTTGHSSKAALRNRHVTFFPPTSDDTRNPTIPSPTRHQYSLSSPKPPSTFRGSQQSPSSQSDMLSNIAHPSMRVSPLRLRSPLCRARCNAPRRPLSTQPRPPSRHAQFYTDYLAAMIPVALLGSAVYIGLRTWQQHLAHERFLEEARVHVQQLEAEVTAQHLLAGARESTSSHTPSEPKKRSAWWPW